MAMDWFRWWHGSLTDPKFQWVARKSGQKFTTVVTLWVAVLEHASSVTQCDALVTRGSVTGFDCDSHDVLFDVDDGSCQEILDAMVAKGLVVDGRIANWEKRQPKREDSSAERTRELRARQRAAKNAPVTGDSVTTGDAPVTHGDAPEEIREEERRVNPSLSGDVNGGGSAGEEAHATSHLLNATTGEENPRPVQLRILLREHGMLVTSNSAEVIEMARADVTDLEITEAVDVFRAKKPNDKPNARYILSMITTAREKAAQAAAASASGPGSSAPVARAVDWWLSNEAITAEGARHGVKWKKAQGEDFQNFRVRVCKAAGEGPWRDHLMNQLLRDKSARHAEIHQYIYGHPPVEVEA